MRVRTVLAGAVVLAFAACTKPPLDEQQKTALADSLEQYVAGPFVATMEHPTFETIMALYAPGNDIQVVENGSIVPSREAVEQGVRAFWAKPGVSGHFTLAAPRVSVLSRDAAVYTTMVTGTIKDSAGVETPLHEAWTAVFVRVGGQWKLQAEHASTPPAPPAAPAQPARPRR